MSKRLYVITIGTILSMLVLSQTSPNPIVSQLVILNIETGDETIVLEENRHFEAPN